MMVLGTRIGRSLFWFTSIAVALASWRFVALGMEGAFPNMIHQLQPARLMFYLHVLAAPVALAIIPFQLSKRFRHRRPGRHRLLGRTYGLMVLFGGISGLLIGTNASGGPIAKTGFILLAMVWLWVTAQAILHARAGRFEQHRAWMIRSAAVTFAAVTLRIWLPLQLVLGIPIEIAYPIVAWLCWIPNLLAAEYILRRSPPVKVQFS